MSRALKLRVINGLLVSFPPPPVPVYIERDKILKDHRNLNFKELIDKKRLFSKKAPTFNYRWQYCDVELRLKNVTIA
jgi:hypothetical protein